MTNTKEHLILFLGDIFFFCVALWGTLWLRYFEIPSENLFIEHLKPFSFLFIIWIIVFFIAGLYEKHTLITIKKLPQIILNAQIINGLLTFLFFYFVPSFGITPKTNVFIYVILSLGLIFVWRNYIVPIIGFRKKQNAILIGSGEEMKELLNEVNSNSRYNLKFVSFVDLNEIEHIDFQKEVIEKIYSENIRSVVVDLRNKKTEQILPNLYNLIFSNVKFIDMDKFYEEIFDKIPLSLTGYNWFIENISSSTHLAYDFLKRAMDMTAAVILGTIS
ncbi:hypothetical protein KKC45_00115, partial [Patescibacteria group bacterium]|nr:hypothetical protein [Patescibacteria group bacterium]